MLLFRGCSWPREPHDGPSQRDFGQAAFGGWMGTGCMGQGLHLCLMKSTESLRLETYWAACGKADVVHTNQWRWGEGRGKTESPPILKAEKATFEQIRAPHGARKKALPRHIKICKNHQASLTPWLVLRRTCTKPTVAHPLNTPSSISSSNHTTWHKHKLEASKKAVLCHTIPDAFLKSALQDGVSHITA